MSVLNLRNKSGYALLLLACSLFVYENFNATAFIDDTFISLRYARNLADGHGLVFNADERVEGFSNLLWTLAIALGAWLGFDPITFCQGLDVVSGLLALVATYRLTAVFLARDQSLIAGCGAFVLYLSMPFCVWARSGLETSLYTALVTFALLFTCRKSHALATACAMLATLTRPEGILIAAIVIFFTILDRPWKNMRTWSYLAAYSICIAALTIFRLVYFGSALPNTFYAKVGGIPLSFGIAYATAFLVWAGGGLIVPAIRSMWSDVRVVPLALFALVHSVYCIAVGGDAFWFSRFYVPILPCLIAMVAQQAGNWDDESTSARAHAWIGFVAIAAVSVGGPGMWAATLALLVAVLVREMVSRQGVPWAVCATTILACIALKIALGEESWRPPWFISGSFRMNYRAVKRDDVDRYNRFIATINQDKLAVLQKRGDGDKLIAAVAIGALGYFGEGRILDMVGLTDAVIARSRAEYATSDVILPGHNRSHASYILSRRPAYIIMDKTGGHEIPALRDLRSLPQFKEEYVWDEEFGGYRRIASEK